MPHAPCPGRTGVVSFHIAVAEHGSATTTPPVPRGNTVVMRITSGDFFLVFVARDCPRLCKTGANGVTASGLAFRANTGKDLRSQKRQHQSSRDLLSHEPPPGSVSSSPGGVMTQPSSGAGSGVQVHSVPLGVASTQVGSGFVALAITTKNALSKALANSKYVRFTSPPATHLASQLKLLYHNVCEKQNSVAVCISDRVDLLCGNRGR